MFELGDVAYYLPYVKFPPNSTIYSTQWLYSRTIGETSAPFGEGQVSVTMGKWDDLIAEIINYPLHMIDFEAFEEDFGIDLANLHERPRWITEILKPTKVSNRPTGAEKSYDSWNIDIKGGELDCGFGDMKLCSFIGPSETFRINVQVFWTNGHKWTAQNLLKCKALHGTPATGLIEQKWKDLQSNVTEYRRWKADFQKLLEKAISQPTSFWWTGHFELLSDERKERWLQEVNRMATLVLGKNAEGLVVTPKWFFGLLKGRSRIFTNNEMPREPTKFTTKIIRQVTNFFTRSKLPLDQTVVPIAPINPTIARRMQWGGTDFRTKQLGYNLDQEEGLKTDFPRRAYTHVKKEHAEEKKEMRKEEKKEKRRKEQEEKQKKLQEIEIHGEEIDVPNIEENVKKHRLVAKTYHMKPMEPEKLIPIAHDLIVPQMNPRWPQIRTAMIDIIKRIQQQPLAPRVRYGILTGYKILQNGEEVRSFEWDSRQPINLWWAICGRQLGSRNSPNISMWKHYDRVMKTEFFPWLKRRLEEVPMPPPLSPEDWVERHKTWSDDKKAGYTATIEIQLKDPKPKNFQGAFRIMAKNGEENLAKAEKLTEGILEGESSKPRVICDPSWQMRGSGAWAQAGVIYPKLKAAVPGFIHGLSCHDLSEFFKRMLHQIGGEDWVCLSYDSKTFDANQNKYVRSTMDVGLWNTVSEQVELWLRTVLPNFPHDKIHKIVNGMGLQARDLETPWFFKIDDLPPELQLTPAEKAEWNRCWPKIPSNDLVRLIFRGSVSSGSWWATTTCNTIRSLSYMWYCLILSGVKEPWKNTNTFCAAAGDDSVMWVPRSMVSTVKENLKKIFSSDINVQQHGLGQCIGDYIINEAPAWDFDFCSKWCLKGEDGETYVTRDYYKTIWNKQVYTGHNEIIQANPEMHPQAILKGLESEGLEGSLLHLLTTLRVVKLGGSLDQRDLQRAQEEWVKEHQWEEKYWQDRLPTDVQAQIDKRCGLTFWNVIASWHSETVSL